MTESDIKTKLDDLLDKLLDNPHVIKEISRFAWKDESNNINIFFNSLDYKGIVFFFQNCAYRSKFKHLLKLSISDDQFRRIVECFLWNGYKRFGYVDSFIYLIDSCFGKETDSLSSEIQNLFFKLNEDAQTAFFTQFVISNNYEYLDIYESNIQEEINKLSIQIYPDKHRIGYFDAYLNEKAIRLSSYESGLKLNAKKNYLTLFQIRLEKIIISKTQERKRESISRIPQEVKYLEEMYFLLEEIDRELYSYNPPANIELIESIIIKLDAFYTSKVFDFTNHKQASIAIASVTNEILLSILRNLDFSQGGLSESLWIHQIKPILIDYEDFKKMYAFLPYTNPEEELAYQLKPFDLTIEELDKFYNKIQTENIDLSESDTSLLFSGQKNTNEILKRYINNSNYNLPEAILLLKAGTSLRKTFKNGGLAAAGAPFAVFSIFNIPLPGIPQLISMSLDFSPIGTLKGIVEAVVGVDIITGEKLELWERLLGFVPISFGEISKIVKSTGKSAAKKSVALAIALSIKVKKVPPSKALRIINKIESIDISAINKASKEIKNSSKVVNGKPEILFSETQANARKEILKVANELALPQPPVRQISSSDTVIKNDPRGTSGSAISDRGVEKTGDAYLPKNPAATNTPGGATRPVNPAVQGGSGATPPSSPQGDAVPSSSDRKPTTSKTQDGVEPTFENPDNLYVQFRGKIPIPRGSGSNIPLVEVIQDGKIDVDDLMDVIPISSKQVEYRPIKNRTRAGFIYQYRSTSLPKDMSTKIQPPNQFLRVEYEVKFHSKDHGTQGMPPNANTKQGWTVQIERKVIISNKKGKEVTLPKELLATNKKWQTGKPSNDTHIPLKGIEDLDAMGPKGTGSPGTENRGTNGGSITSTPSNAPKPFRPATRGSTNPSVSHHSGSATPPSSPIASSPPMGPKGTGSPGTGNNPNPNQTSINRLPTVFDGKKPTKYGGFKSWRSDVYIGTSTERFKENVSALIAQDRNHPLRKLLGKDNVLQSPPKNAKYNEKMMQPEWVEMGHVRSSHVEGEQIIFLQSSFQNQRMGKDFERTGHVVAEELLDIGGIAVHPLSAWDWVDAGLLDKAVVENARRIKITQ